MITDTGRRLEPGALLDRQEILRRSVRRSVYTVAMALAMLGALLPPLLNLPFAFSFAIPVSLLVLMISLERPQMAILGVLVARTLIDVLWYTRGSIAGITLPQMASGGIVAVLTLIVALRPATILAHRLILVFAVFGVFSGIGILMGDDGLSMANATARLLGTVALCVLATTFFRDVNGAKDIMIVLTASAILPNVIGLYYYFTNQGMIELDSLTRAFGAYANLHNTAHAMAAFASFGGFWLYVRGFDRWGIAAGVIAVVSVISLYLTLVRTPMVGIAAEFIVFTLLERRFRVLAGGVALTAVAMVNNPTLSGRFVEFTALWSNSGRVNDSLGSGRWGLWVQVVTNFSEKPFFNLLFGVGLNNHLLLNNLGWDTHNDYLALLTQTGPISLLAFVWAQIVLVLACWRLARITNDEWVRVFANFMIAFNAGVTVMNFVSNSYASRIHIGWFFWTLAGVIFGLLITENRRLAATK